MTQNRVPQGVLVRFRPGAPTRLFKPVPKRPHSSAQCSETLEKQAFPRTSVSSPFVLIRSQPSDLLVFLLVSGEQTFTATFAIPNEGIEQMARKNDGACANPKQIRTDVDCRAARPKFDDGAWSPAKIWRDRRRSLSTQRDRRNRPAIGG